MIDDLNIWIANIRMDIQTMLNVTWLSRLKSGNVPQCNRAWLQRTRLTRTSQAQLRKGEKYLRFLKLWLEFTQTFLSNIKHSVSVSGAIIENYPSNIPALQLHNYCSSQWFTGLSQHFLFHLVEAGWGQQIYYKTRGGQYPALAQSLDCDWRRLMVVMVVVGRTVVQPGQFTVHCIQATLHQQPLKALWHTTAIIVIDTPTVIYHPLPANAAAAVVKHLHTEKFSNRKCKSSCQTQKLIISFKICNICVW